SFPVNCSSSKLSSATSSSSSLQKTSPIPRRCCPSTSTSVNFNGNGSGSITTCKEKVSFFAILNSNFTHGDFETECHNPIILKFSSFHFRYVLYHPFISYFMPDIVIPSTTYLWNNMQISKINITMMSSPAICKSKSDSCCPCSNDKPTDNVYRLSSFAMINGQIKLFQEAIKVRIP